MTVKRMFLPCACGGQIMPATLWVSKDFKLVIEGICDACTQVRSVFYTYESLVQQSESFGESNRPLRPPLALPPPSFSKEDISLLADMNISLEGYD